jgi:hypothetical protein
MSDENVIGFAQKFNIEATLRAGLTEQPPMDSAAEPAASFEPDWQELAKKADPLPETAQERYRPHAAFLNRLQSEQRTFYCVYGDCTFEGFPYAHYDGIRFERAASPGGGMVLVVRFSGSVVKEVRIEGRNLRFMAVCIGMGVMPWIWELPPGQKVAADGATVVSRLTITEIKH